MVREMDINFWRAMTDSSSFYTASPAWVNLGVRVYSSAETHLWKLGSGMFLVVKYRGLGWNSCTLVSPPGYPREQIGIKCHRRPPEIPFPRGNAAEEEQISVLLIMRLLQISHWRRISRALEKCWKEAHERPSSSHWTGNCYEWTAKLCWILS